MKAGKPGEYVITKIEAVSAPGPATAAPKPEAHKH
jgi:hypothetical protein